MQGGVLCHSVLFDHFDGYQFGNRNIQGFLFYSERKIQLVHKELRASLTVAEAKV